MAPSIWRLSHIAAIALLIVHTHATPKADSDEDGNGLLFTISVPEDTNDQDIYFNISAPVTDSWVGVGLGDEMTNALMFVMYSNSRDGVTISPRTASKHVEPSVAPNVNITHLAGSEISGGIMKANIRCSGCRKWSTGSLDVDNTDADFIFARGPPGQAINSNSLDAHIQHHQSIGHFTMDLTQAYDATEQTELLKEGENADDVADLAGSTLMAHGVFMIMVFYGLLPGGLILLRVFNKSMGHAINQGVSLLFALIGFGLGVKLSKMRDETRHLGTGHQVIGLLVVIALIGQFILGAAHHYLFKRTNRATPLAVPHVWIGRGIMFFGIINSFLGYPLSSRPKGDFVLMAFLFVLIAIFAYLGLISFREFHRFQPKRSWFTRSAPPSTNITSYPTYPTATVHEHELKYQINTPTIASFDPKKGGGSDGGSVSSLTGKLGLGGRVKVKVKNMNISRPHLISGSNGMRDGEVSELAASNEPAEYRGSKKGANVGLSRFQSPMPMAEPFGGRQRREKDGHGDHDVDSDGDDGDGIDDYYSGDGRDAGPPHSQGDLTLDTSARGLGWGKEMQPVEMV